MNHDPSSLPPELRPPDADAAQDYERIWHALRRTDEARGSEYDVDAAWAELAGRLDLDTSPRADDEPIDDRPPRSSARSTAARVRQHGRTLAATMLVLCAVAVGAWWWQQPVSVTTAAGERTTVSLPDGSTVELSGNTRLTYDRGFQALPLMPAAQRRVRLTGKAFFDVEAQRRSFHVVTPNARVEVLGTTFHVHTQTAGDSPKSTVTLASGRVRFRSTADAGAAPRSGVTLSEPGRTSRVVGTQAPTSPQTVDLKYVQAWRKGGFAVQNATLPTVLQELERRFGVPLSLRAPPASTTPMTLHYAAEAQLDDVLRDICVIQGLSYRETSRGYELFRD